MVHHGYMKNLNQVFITHHVVYHFTGSLFIMNIKFISLFYFQAIIAEEKKKKAKQQQQNFVS